MKTTLIFFLLPQYVFHGNDEPNPIQSKYCAIWNPKIGSMGAWDTENVKMAWSDDYVAECISTKFGTFAIVSELYEPPTVPDDKQWVLLSNDCLQGCCKIISKILFVAS